MPPGVPASVGGNELVYARALAAVVASGVESPDWRSLFHLAIGILLVTVLGEAARQAALRLRGTRPG